LSEDKKTRDLLLQAVKDPTFRAEFLSNPEAIAKRFEVKLKPEQLEKIKKASAFIASLDDLRLPPGPIFYPVDPVINQIKIIEVANVLKYLYIDKLRWIFYPADVLNRGQIITAGQRRVGQ